MIQNKSSFMITCKQSTEWVIKKEYKKLSVKENLQLLSHMTICSFCRLFQSQNLLISKALYASKSKEIFQLSAKEKNNLLQSVKNKV
ncbi:MAG: hypothetical protein ABIQ07_06580, partial [Ginsengibacter sp.]